ncbi:MAG: hypothetical protein JNM79_17690 [Burkholderiales bacterium]|nr:hypothetical protein [Burkholderiales bacterium]
MSMKTLPASTQTARRVRLAPLALLLARAGLATLALPVSAATLPALPAMHVAPMVYLAQQSGDDGYGTVPHLRPRPEGGVAAPKPAPTAGPSSGSGVAPRPSSSPPPPPPDGRNSTR